MTPHGHDHGPRPGNDADSRLLWLALTLIAVFMVFEIVVALASGSLALLADAGHMLTDVGAIGASIWAIRLARRPARGRWTYGFKRSEILSAAVNGVTLLVVGLLVAYEAVRRLIDPPKVTGGALLIVAGVGIVINVAASFVLARADRSKLNVEGAYQHILTDAFAFIATLVAGVVIVTTDFRRADPIASLFVVALMVRAAAGLLKRSGRILLEAAPDGVDLDVVRAHILGAEHVRGVHDLHAWVVTSDLPALSAHVVVDDSCFNDGHAPRILDHLQSCLAGHFDVEHSTFQLESSAHADHEAGAHN
jgi:cobalt-zinc-cadmium efflux system protein